MKYYLYTIDMITNVLKSSYEILWTCLP